MFFKLSLTPQNMSNNLSELDYKYSLKIIHNTLKSSKVYVLSVLLLFMYFFSDFLIFSVWFRRLFDLCCMLA